MLKSDFRHKAHANLQDYIFVCNDFFLHIDAKSTPISHKIEVYIESNFNFSVIIDVCNHFNATNIENTIVCVKIALPHIISLIHVKRRYPIL